MTESSEIPKTPRGFKGSALLVGMSLTPLVLDLLIIHFKLIRKLLALPILFGIIATSIFSGMRWYKWFHRYKGVAKHEVGGLDEKADWLAFATAVIVGLGVAVLIQELFTHEMVRAYHQIIDTSTDEN